MFPIKYIENNLVFNHDGECFAYYELTPYNYSFLSPEEKYMVHDNLRQLIAQNRDGKIHALQIATEYSLRALQERSKKGITGRLKEIACKKVDEQTEALVEMIGENQIDYRFFLGFKLLVNEEEINLKAMRKSAAMTFTDFIYEVNHKLMGDFVSMSNDEINRFLKMEKLLESKISRRFQFRRLDKNDFGYLLEHIYGNTGVAYSDYSYDLPAKKLKSETLVKRYDLIRPTRCQITENQRYLKIEREDQTTYASYTKFEEYTTMELLSVAMLIVISTFALDFIHSDRSIFKMVDLDEAWTFLQVAQGKALSNKLIRAGRSMNAAVYFVTQNSGDVDDEKMKNNIGLKFAFRSTDIKEIKNTLEFFGVDKQDEGNQKRLRDLENGQCLFQDLYGRVGVIQIHPVFSDLFHAFDTRPPVQTEETR